MDNVWICLQIFWHWFNFLSVRLTLSLEPITIYYLVPLFKTWTEAQSYCRENYVDLATIETAEHWEGVRNLVGNSINQAWIGLYDDVNNWRWSMNNTYLYDGSNTAHESWFTFVTDNHRSMEHCVAIYGYTLVDNPCALSQKSVCYDGECSVSC